ncbi:MULTISPECIES: hypothetical protein [Klebsiella]|uniref:hypothetical protein n=1 Tax=Klebsiella TaxID=570 RepID=UPI0012B7D807|nr:MULTISPECIES: hypothetical protein [Klebsiella]ELR9567077.1 hypothetical protein [Klebsiella michiganensis]MBM1114519.1 hypothetical protein [Klebsiella grimontii]HDX8853315.1 hypothetical protein [Klebsiella michiganensis]
MTVSKELKVRYTRGREQFEKSFPWDGCAPVDSALTCLVEEHNLVTLIPAQERVALGGIRNLHKPVNLLEHGFDDVFFYDDEINKWERIPDKWLTDV